MEHIPESPDSGRHRAGTNRRGRRRPANRKGPLIALTAVVAAAGVGVAVLGVGGFGGDDNNKADGNRTPAAASADPSTPAFVAGNGGLAPSQAAIPGAPTPEGAVSIAPPTPSASASAKPSSKAPVSPPASPTPPRKPTTAPATTTAPAGGGSTAFVTEVVRIVNRERAANGCGPVTDNTELRTAALRHSQDMDARDYFDHKNPDGQSPGDRITKAGYRWSTYGENIAAGQKTPESVMQSWMNSPGHRANILNCSFKEIGVGVHVASGGPWWTQVFGAR